MWFLDCFENWVEFKLFFSVDRKSNAFRLYTALENYSISPCGVLFYIVQEIFWLAFTIVIQSLHFINSQRLHTIAHKTQLGHYSHKGADGMKVKKYDFLKVWETKSVRILKMSECRPRECWHFITSQVVEANRRLYNNNVSSCCNMRINIVCFSPANGKVGSVCAVIVIQSLFHSKETICRAINTM